MSDEMTVACYAEDLTFQQNVPVFNVGNIVFLISGQD